MKKPRNLRFVWLVRVVDWEDLAGQKADELREDVAEALPILCSSRGEAIRHAKAEMEELADGEDMEWKLEKLEHSIERWTAQAWAVMPLYVEIVPVRLNPRP